MLTTKYHETFGIEIENAIYDNQRIGMIKAMCEYFRDHPDDVKNL